MCFLIHLHMPMMTCPGSQFLVGRTSQLSQEICVIFWSFLLNMAIILADLYFFMQFYCFCSPLLGKHLEVDGTFVSKAGCTTYLDVTICSNLRWSLHIFDYLKRILCLHSEICRMRQFDTKQAFINFFVHHCSYLALLFHLPFRPYSRIISISIYWDLSCSFCSVWIFYHRSIWLEYPRLINFHEDPPTLYASHMW